MSDEKYSDIFILFRQRLKRIASAIVPAGEIEDIVQESYVKLWQASENTDIREPKAFLTATVRNLALNYVLKAESRLTVSLENEAENGFHHDRSKRDTTVQVVVSDQEFAFFCRVVRSLPLRCQRVFVLRKVYGYSQYEISKELGISESTVEKHIAMGMKRCKQRRSLEGDSHFDIDKKAISLNPPR